MKLPKTIEFTTNHWHWLLCANPKSHASHEYSTRAENGKSLSLWPPLEQTFKPQTSKSHVTALDLDPCFRFFSARVPTMAPGFPHQSTMVTVWSVWRCHINWKSSIKFRTAHNRPEAVKVAFGISIPQRWNVDVYNHQADIVRPRFLKQKKAYPYWAVKSTLHIRQNLIFVAEMYEFCYISIWNSTCYCVLVYVLKYEV